MRRIIFLFSSVLIFFLFFAFWNNKVHAQTSTCQLSIPQTIFPPDYQGNAVIKGNGNCFRDGITYIILFYPLNTTPNLYSNFLAPRQQYAGTGDSITVPLNLFAGSLGKSNPGTWAVKVCVANSSADCGGDSSSNSNILGNVIPITVSGVPTPTPTPIPTNLPKASVFPNQCTYQVNSSITILLYDLQPNLEYQWWWDGDIVIKNDFIRTTGSNSSYALDIPSSETTRTGTRIFCVDIANSWRCSSGSQNSVTLRLTLDSPPKDGSAACITTSTGRQDLQNTPPSPTPTSPLPPCSQWADLLGTPIPTDSPNIQNADYPKKCASVSTGLGIDVSTDAGALVKSVFGVILSISGGIALILIIISGYGLIFSQGNPEAVKAAQERLTSAIVGLLFIIFSLVILQIIGADILKIPGFSK